MAYIKWIKGHPYVYISYTNDYGTQKDLYRGSYAKYRDNKPCGSFKLMVKPETVIKWISKNPERLNLLNEIDNAMHTKYEC